MSKLLTLGVCTYKRSDMLENLLRSLVLQMGDDCELIINDDSGDEETKNTIERHRSQIHHLVVLSGGGQGLSHGRRNIVSASQAEWVAFLDDDVVLSPFWVKNVRDVINSNRSSYDIIGGPAFPAYTGSFKQSIPKNCLEKLSVLHTCGKGVIQGKYPIGANFLVKKAVFDRFSFSDGLGRIGSNLASNEETALFKYVGRRRIGYFSAISVFHCVDVARLNDGWLEDRYRAEGQSHVKMLRMYGSSWRVWLYGLKIVFACTVSFGRLRRMRLQQLIGIKNEVFRT